MNSEGAASQSGIVKVGDKLVRVDGTLIDTLTDGKLSHTDAAAHRTALPPVPRAQPFLTLGSL